MKARKSISGQILIQTTTKKQKCNTKVIENYLVHSLFAILVLAEEGRLTVEVKAKLFERRRCGRVGQGENLGVEMCGYRGRAEEQWWVFG